MKDHKKPHPKGTKSLAKEAWEKSERERKAREFEKAAAETLAFRKEVGYYGKA